MALTKRQKQVFDVLQRFINAHGYSPSFEEIAKALKLSSLATVHKHIATLERKGFIRRGYNRRAKERHFRAQSERRLHGGRSHL